MTFDAMSVQNFQGILRALPDPLLVVSSTLEIEYANSAFEEMLGAASKQARGKNINELGLEAGSEWGDLVARLEDFSKGIFDKDKINSSGNDKARELINDPLTPKNSFNPYHNRPKIGFNSKIFFYEFFKVLDSEKSDSLIAVLFREITKDIEINDQMVQAEKMSGLGTLAAGLAHELNNPLYTIIGFSEMIIKEHDKAKIDSISKRIRERSKELVGILENLNSYIQSNPVDGHMTVNINERLDAALGVALMACESKDISVHKDYSSLPLLKARADEIQQIFFNIITNSIQAMRGRGEIRISSTKNDKEIVVVIQDTGEGVPKEYVSKVFDPFFTTKDQGEGTGLGLTAAYQLAKKNGGSIKFDSVQGEGTVVEIHWPMKDDTVL